MVIINGNTKGDRKGHWTFKRGSGRSVINYGIVNLEAWGRVKYMEIGFRVESDHLPICIELEGKRGRKERHRIRKEGRKLQI